MLIGTCLVITVFGLSLAMIGRHSRVMKSIGDNRSGYKSDCLKHYNMNSFHRHNHVFSQ